MAGDSVKFAVEGLPVAQGSKVIARGGGKVWLRDANAAKLKAWRTQVAKAADVGVTFDCPVIVFAVFYLAKPKKLSWWAPAGRVGDIDKLGRALLDGMTDGGLLVDDSRVVDAHLFKRYASNANPAGVRVLVMEATDG